MRKHRLGIDQATHFILVGRAVQREFISAANYQQSTDVIQRLISKISLENILYESTEEDDDLDDDGIDGHTTATTSNIVIQGGSGGGRCPTAGAPSGRRVPPASSVPGKRT